MNIEQKKVVIDELLRESILTVVQLKAGADIPSAEQLYQRCKQQVTQVRETLHQAQYSQSVIDDISYALCALLDETVLLCSRDHRNGHDYDQWLGEPLQVIFFNTHNAGYDLFDKIRARLKEDRPELLVLRCFDLVLGIGFQGCYLGQPQMEREHLMLALREAVRSEDPNLSYPIIEQHKVYRYWGRKSLLILSTVLSIVVVIGLYFFFDYELQKMLSSLLQKG